MFLETDLTPYSALEDLKRQDEKENIERLLHELEFLKKQRSGINKQAKIWIEKVREIPLSAFSIQRFLQTFPLTHVQGRSLLALAEAYLRIPDSYTANLLLKDKLSNQDWHHEGFKEGAVTGLSQWGLNFLEYVQNQPWASVTNPISFRIFKTFMHLLSHEFILGQTIEEALHRRLKMPQDLISFDMLGEGARTFSMAKSYKNAYTQAIQAIGKIDNKRHSTFERDSISVKLSALHPHYRFSHHKQVMKELLPILIELCVQARNMEISLTIDAEESALVGRQDN